MRIAPSLFAIGLLSRASLSTAAQEVSLRPARIEVATPKAPTPVVANGRRVLAYELHVTNLGPGALGFRQLDVFDGRPGGAQLATYRDSSLAELLEPAGSAMRATMRDPRKLEPGERTLVFLWLSLAPDSRPPATLRHRFLFDILDTADVRRDRGTRSALDSVFVSVSREDVPVVSAPLAGGEWVAASGPSNESSHRRALNALAGKGWIAERFAIDWNRVGPNGNTYHDDEHVNADYWSFGQQVHAVADGEVVAAIDTIDDHAPHGPTPPVTLANIAGNYVTIKIGPRRYATFAHLKHGSVRVRVHQHVVRGDIVALVGNTGQSTAPHLHFQITDGSDVLASEGIPFYLERFTFLGNAADFEENHHPTVVRRRDMPLENQVIGLP